MNIKEKAINHMKERNEKPIKEFMEKIGIEETIAYEYLANYTTLVIYTKCPEIWIGRHGENELLLKEILKSNFNHEIEIEYDKIRGDFITR